MFQLNGFLSNKCTFIRLLICKHIICLSTGQHLFGVRSSKRTTWGPRPSAKLDTTESVAHSNTCSVSFNSGEQASSSKDSHHLTLSSITDMQTYSYANLLVSIYLGYDLLRTREAISKAWYYGVCSTFKYMFRLFQLGRTGIFIKRQPSSHIIVTIVILKVNSSCYWLDCLS